MGADCPGEEKARGGGGSYVEAAVLVCSGEETGGGSETHVSRPCLMDLEIGR
jgi:hypothetical protein